MPERSDQHTHTHSFRPLYLCQTGLFTCDDLGWPFTWSHQFSGDHLKIYIFIEETLRPRLGLFTLVKCSPFMGKCPNNMGLKSRTWNLREETSKCQAFMSASGFSGKVSCCSKFYCSREDGWKDLARSGFEPWTFRMRRSHAVASAPGESESNIKN